MLCTDFCFYNVQMCSVCIDDYNHNELNEIMKNEYNYNYGNAFYIQTSFIVFRITV